MGRPRWAAPALLLAVLAVLAPSTARGQSDTVRLMLRFDHQYQFAGYYVALWDGLYRERGLHVEIEPGVTAEGRLIEVGPRLAAGEFEFGVMGSDALLSLAGGDDIVLLAPIFQRSPIAAFYHADLQVDRPADLARYRIGEAQSKTATAEVVAMIAADGVPPWTLGLTPVNSREVVRHLQRFFDREFDVLLGYDLSVPWLARQAGVPVEALDPDEWGVEFYGDALFASAEFVERRPDLAEAFLEASLEGWRRALENGEAVADRIARDLPRSIPVEDREAYNRFLVPKVRELVLPSLIPVGANDPARWDRMSTVLTAAGILPEAVDIRTHHFDPGGERRRLAAARRRALERGGLVALLLLGAVALGLFVRGRNERAHRLSLELALQRSARLESLGRLAGGIAHDFNNLLTAVQGHADLIRSEAIARSDPGAAEHAGHILGATRRAEALIRQLLAFGRRQDLEPRPVSVARLVADLEPMLRRLIPERIRLRTELAPEAVVEADPGRLEQVLTNLVVNAADAIAEAGQITVTVKCVQLYGRHSRAAPEGLEPGRYVRICVADTGHGIPPETLERIFEPFFTTREDDAGTGLGLATVHGIVTQSGGHISAKSTPGAGTEFVVLLPASDRLPDADPAEPQAPESLPSPKPGLAHVVLLVEDDEAVRGLARSVLERAGLEVLEAADGREALAVAARERDRIDLALTDVVMPEMDGPTLVGRLREIEPSLPVVLMSGYSELELSEMLHDGRTRYLSKPYSPRELLEAVTWLLGEDAG